MWVAGTVYNISMLEYSATHICVINGFTFIFMLYSQHQRIKLFVWLVYLLIPWRVEVMVMWRIGVMFIYVVLVLTPNNLTMRYSKDEITSM